MTHHYDSFSTTYVLSFFFDFVAALSFLSFLLYLKNVCYHCTSTGQEFESSATAAGLDVVVSILPGPRPMQLIQVTMGRGAGGGAGAEEGELI